MALNLKNNPTGADKLVDRWQNLLYNGLTSRGWTGYESYPRAYRNIDDDKTNPEHFLSENEYKGILMDDGFTVTSFFLVSDTSTDDGMTESTISVIFQADLKNLYGERPHRFDEELINDIKVVSRGLDGRFTEGDTFRGIDDVYSGFDTDKIKEALHDHQPYNVVRVDMTVRYQYDCGDEYATSGETCNIAVTVSTTPETSAGADNGTATANDTGGQGNITYLWDDPLNQTTKTAIGLAPAIYTVIVTDDIITSPACTATDSGEVAAAVGKPPEELSNLKIYTDPSDTSKYNTTGISDQELINNVESIAPADVVFTQGTISNQPKYHASGLGVNNLPYEEFIRSTGNALVSTYGYTGSYSFVVAVEANSEVDGMNIFDNQVAGGSGPRLFLNEAAGSLFVNFTTTAGIMPVASFQSGELVFISGSFNGATGDTSVKINDGSYNSATLGIRDLSNFTFGSRAGNPNLENYDGKKGISCVWEALHTEGDLDDVVEWMRDKYGETF